MVDDHTLEKISHSGKRIPPSTSSRVIFFLQSVIFFPRVVNVCFYKRSYTIFSACDALLEYPSSGTLKIERLESEII